MNSHLPQIIQDLALILVVAAFVSLVFKKLKQPVVLGYLVAGMLVGPHQPWFPTVSDIEGINVWAEIGVIFLLFAIGLEFSFRKLISVGTSAGITTAFQVIIMMLLGFAAGQFMGWDWINSLFLGSVISISSTTIIVKTFDDLGLKGRRFVSLVVGILIFEDLVAVLLMVLLSTLAISREFHGIQLLEQVSRFVFFLCLWFMVGVFVLPNLVKRIRLLLNHEATLIISLGLCFLMVVLANKAGFSPALGAFIMGSLLAETTEGERIEHVITSVKDLFSAIFFVSVGMLLDPGILVQHWQMILFMTVVLIFGKIFSVTFGAWISGQNLKTSVQAGLSLAQIGEFSYIMASLGSTLKITNNLLYPLAISLSLATAFTTPYLVGRADAVYGLIERLLPVHLHKALATNGWAHTRKEISFTPQRGYLKNFGLKMFLNTVIIVAIFLAMSQGVLPWVREQTGNNLATTLINLAITLFLAAPFFWALVFSKVDGQTFSIALRNRAARPSIVMLSLFRIAWGLILLSVLVTQFIPEVFFIIFLLLILWVFTLMAYSRLERLYEAIEGRFLSNLQRKGQEERAEQEETLARSEIPPLAPWDAHLVEFGVPQDANYVGIPLDQLSIREKYGVTIALIRRGNRRITAPGRGEMLMPFDHIFAIGTDEQLLRFKMFLDQDKSVEQALGTSQDFTLEQYVVSESSAFVGKTIRTSGLREATKGIVVGVERAGKRILNPDSNLILESGDLLWVVGDRKLIRSLS